MHRFSRSSALALLFLTASIGAGCAHHGMYGGANNNCGCPAPGDGAAPNGAYGGGPTQQPTYPPPGSGLFGSGMR